MIDIYPINEFFSWQFWAFFGIVLEIGGFVLMTFLWGKYPTMKEYHKWIDDHKSLMDEWRSKMTLIPYMKAKEEKKWYKMLHWSTMYINDVEEDKQNGYSDTYNAVVRYQEVPNKFRIEWTLKTKVISIIPVIVGLGFQGYQLIRF